MGPTQWNTVGFFPGVKRARREADRYTPTAPRAEVGYNTSMLALRVVEAMPVMVPRFLHTFSWRGV
jgi:hypothetical protein